MPVEAVVEGVDAVLVSHLHSDHFDAAAVQPITSMTIVSASMRPFSI